MKYPCSRISRVELNPSSWCLVQKFGLNSIWIDFALLLGTNFSQRIVNVGPKRAYKFIKNHGSIERIIELETKYEPRVSGEDYLSEVELGRLIYKTLPSVPLKELKKKDDKKVIVLLRRHGLFQELGELEATEYQAHLDGNFF